MIVSAGSFLGRQASWTACNPDRGISHFRAGCLIGCAPRMLLAKGGSAGASLSHRCRGRNGDAGTMPEIGKSNHALFQNEAERRPPTRAAPSVLQSVRLKLIERLKPLQALHVRQAICCKAFPSCRHREQPLPVFLVAGISGHEPAFIGVAFVVLDLSHAPGPWS